MEHGLLLNDAPLEREFPGEVQKHYADQQGDNALSGQYQHRNTDKEKDGAHDILDNQASEAKR